MALFTIGATTFPSKEAAKKAVQKILNQTPVGMQLAGEELALIRALIDLHYQAELKLSKGCTGICVRMNRIQDMPPMRSFHIIRDDGSTIDFSYTVPFDSIETLKRKDVIWAARLAIRPLLKETKEKYFNGKDFALCQATGAQISWKDAVVDHAGEWPFSRILNDWLLWQQPSEPKLIYHDLYTELNPEDAASFLAFHNERAQLRVIHKKENGRLGARGE